VEITTSAGVKVKAGSVPQEASVYAPDLYVIDSFFPFGEAMPKLTLKAL
jgi:hypothetical protein